MRVDGGEILVRTLLANGVREVFTLHGGHLDAVYQAARGTALRFVDTRHEQAAGHAADGYARTTGRTGVAMATAGPGVTGLVTAVANAYLDCVPTLFLGGAAPLREAETLPLQGGFDQVDLMRPITKWAHRITHTERIADLVAQGLRVARSGRPGPVFLEIPIDVLFAGIELPGEAAHGDEATCAREAPGIPATAAAPAADLVARALDWLGAAERPVILAGGGAWFSGIRCELVELAEATGIPVLSNGKAHGLVPSQHPLCGGSFAMVLPALAAMVGPPDAALLLGARLGMFTGGRGGGALAGARLIQVDVAPEEIGRNRRVDLAIAADCREAARALGAAAARRPRPDRSAWADQVRGARAAMRAAWDPSLAGDGGAIHPLQLAREVVRAAGPDAVVVADGGETSTWMEIAAEVSGGGRWLSHGYLGCLGTGLPFAIAAKVAHPERTVVCVVGDGSVGLNLAEFDTMARHDLAIVTVVSNDRQWGMSAHGQDLIFGPGRRVVTDLAPTRYDLAAAGLGCHAEHVERAADLGPALERALAAGAPACVDVHTDPSAISPVTLAMVGALGPTVSGDEGRGRRVATPYYGNLEEA